MNKTRKNRTVAHNVKKILSFGLNIGGVLLLYSQGLRNFVGRKIYLFFMVSQNWFH